MAHICLIYVPQDSLFAEQLGIQLHQRGYVLEPVPDPTAPSGAPLPDYHAALATATHVLILLSPAAVESDDLRADWESVLKTQQHAIVILHETCSIPNELQALPLVDFRGRFLLAVEELVKQLRKLKAATRPLTVEYAPPVVKPQLMPIALPSERCWREDRLRIRYRLPILLPLEELEVRLPAFITEAGFEVVHTTPKRIVLRRTHRRYTLFDPRRTEHTLTIKPRKGSLRVNYQMTRLQVYHWFPAHYHVLDREAAALYRYLAMGDLAHVLHPVEVMARRARWLSWMALVLLVVFIIAVSYLIIV